MRSVIKDVVQLFVLFGIVICAPYCSGIAISLVVDMWDVLDIDVCL